MANEGAELGAAGRDARRLLLSRMIVDHKLVAPNPLSIDGSAFDDTATDALLSDAPVSLEEASRILTL